LRTLLKAEHTSERERQAERLDAAYQGAHGLNDMVSANASLFHEFSGCAGTRH